MRSAIGDHFKSQRARRWAVVVGLASVGVDMVFVVCGIGYDARLALAMMVFALIVCLADGDLCTIGLCSNPRQGWKPWIRLSVILGLSVAVCIVLGLGIWKLTGHEIPIYTTPPTQVFGRVLLACFIAPVMEESVYRLILCVSLMSVLGCWKTIGVSGLLFGSLHFLYGNPSPENLVGGFILAWAYLKSETILLPVILHSLGNSFVIAAQVMGWYVLNSG
ncbi:MAG: CPBP family intramembrane metalloprotease [Planctomycetaceae bacterium]|nr:CPBP family intramembrane metalloprotease [Planctomycetaceae bacterium]